MKGIDAVFGCERSLRCSAGHLSGRTLGHNEHWSV